jgi:SNF2 family DNA or RNA helicase
MLTNFKPYKHQQYAYDQYVDKLYGAFFCQMGTGKTKIILDLLLNSKEQGAIIMAPNGLHLNWYYSEIPKHAHKDVYPLIYCWKGSLTTIKAKKELADFMAADHKFKFFLINIEAIRTKSGYDPAEKFLKSLQSSHIVIDESICIKNPKATQTKAALKLSKLADRRWILNGTPMTQGPLDLYSQCKFLNKNSIPYNSYTAFKTTYANEIIETFQNRSFLKIVGYKNLDQLREELRPFSLKLDKEDCLDLPEKTFMDRLITLTAEQLKAYKTMRDLCLAEMQDGTIVTVQQAIVKMLKLHQILTGFLKDEQGEVHEIKNNRLPALLDIAESSQPLVIFCAYKQNVASIKQALSEKYSKNSVVTYDGDTKSKDRTDAVTRFQSGEAKFFIGTSAAAKGLTLHKAHNMVYYSLDRSLSNRLQSQDRIHRIGQTEKCTYIDLICPNTLDQQIQKALNDKKELDKMTLNDLRQMF